MSDVVIEGIPVMYGSLTLARRGNWQGRFAFADESFPEGVFTGTILGETFTGFARRSAAPLLQAQMFAVGGKGNLHAGQLVEPRDFRYASFADVVTQLIEDGGETVAADTLVGRDQQFIGWTRFQTPIVPELELLCGQRTDGTDWRVRLNDGAIEVKPLVTRAVSPNVILLQDLVTERKRIYALEDETQGMQLLPGDVLSLPGDPVGEITIDTVEYSFDPDRTRVVVYWGPTQYDRATELFQEMFNVGMSRYHVRQADPFALYQGTVQSVRGNGNIDVLCDDKRVGYVNDCEIYNGLPGWQVKPIARSLTTPGARVLVGWSAGDKSRKYACSWGANPAQSLESATIEASTLIEYKTPMHRVDGTSEVINGDDRTEHDVGIGPALRLVDCTIKPGAGAAGSVSAISGHDSAFVVTIQADPGADPPTSGGDVVEVRFRRGYGTAPIVVVSGGDGPSGGLGPGASSTALATTLAIGKGMTKGVQYKFNVIVKGNG